VEGVFRPRIALGRAIEVKEAAALVHATRIMHATHICRRFRSASQSHNHHDIGLINIDRPLILLNLTGRQSVIAFQDQYLAISPNLKKRTSQMELLLAKLFVMHSSTFSALNSETASLPYYTSFAKMLLP
jgi:hypothetical protein